MSVFPTAEKTLNVLVNVILPLCIRMGGGSNRAGKQILLHLDLYHIDHKTYKSQLAT